VGADPDRPSEMQLRQEAPVIPLEILTQKWLMHKAMVVYSIGNIQEAKDYLTQSLNHGTLFSAHIRHSTIKKLTQILKEEGKVNEGLE
jgi:3-dehydroquinate synthase class II